MKYEIQSRVDHNYTPIYNIVLTVSKEQILDERAIHGKAKADLIFHENIHKTLDKAIEELLSGK